MIIEFEKVNVFASKTEVRSAHNAWAIGMKNNEPILLAPSRIPEVLQFCKEHNLGLSVADSKEGQLPIWLYRKTG